MKTKLFSFIFALFLTLFSFVQSASALVYSEADIYQKINQLNVIMNTDYISFINKADLVGYRLSTFEMQTMNYKNQARMNIESLNSLLEQIKKIRNSSDLSPSDKNVQIASLYQNANNMMFDMNNATLNYLRSLNFIMPTITYSRFVKKYQTFYNGLNLTDTDISF